MNRPCLQWNFNPNTKPTDSSSAWATKLPSSRFQSNSIQLPGHFWYWTSEARDASPVFSEHFKAERERERGRLWNKPICFFSVSVDQITFWMFGKSFVNLWLNIPFHEKFEARRLQADNCSFGAPLCILQIIVNTGVFLSSSGEMPKVTLQSLILVWIFCCKSCYRCLRCLAGYAVKLKALYFLVALLFSIGKFISGAASAS